MEKLSKNFMWMAASNIVSSLFNVVLFLYLARALMPEAFGYLSYAFTLIFFLSSFIELGLSTYGIREIAKDPPRASAYASEIISLRIVITAALSVLIIAAACLSPRSLTLKVLICESSLMLFIFALGTEWAFQGLERMGMVFFSFASSSALQLGLIWTFVKGPEDLLKVPVLYFIATVPVIAILLKNLRFRPMMKREDLARIALYLRRSLMIWSISVVAQVYNSLDILLLGLFRSTEEVGYFTVTRRVVGGFIIFIIFLANAVLPSLSAAFNKDMIRFRMTTRRFLRLAVIISVFAILPLILFSRQFILLTFGPGYLPADLTLKIMGVGLVLVLVSIPYSTALIACHLEKEVLRQVAASAALSLVVNFMLMPRYGMLGASISFALAEALAIAWILWVYKRKIGLRTV